MKKAILEIAFLLLDKFLPWKLKKRLPLIFIEPKKIVVNASEWHHRQSFFVKNIYKKPLFEVYILVEYKPAAASDIEIEKNNINEEHQVTIKDIILNYDFAVGNFRLDGVEEASVIRIHQINPGITDQFKITCKASCEINLKVLGFSNEESKIIIKEGAAAIPITIPEGAFGEKRIEMTAQKFLTKKVN